MVYMKKINMVSFSLKVGGVKLQMETFSVHLFALLQESCPSSTNLFHLSLHFYNQIDTYAQLHSDTPVQNTMQCGCRNQKGPFNGP